MGRRSLTSSSSRPPVARPHLNKFPGFPPPPDCLARSLPQFIASALLVGIHLSRVVAGVSQFLVGAHSRSLSLSLSLHSSLPFRLAFCFRRPSGPLYHLARGWIGGVDVCALSVAIPVRIWYCYVGDINRVKPCVAREIRGASCRCDCGGS